MMVEIIIAVISGGVGAAVASGIMGLIQYKVKRKDDKNDASDDIKAALRYIMLFIIRQQAMEFIRDGEISFENRRMLHKWYDLYHSETLHGNGDAAGIMKIIDALPLKTEED